MPYADVPKISTWKNDTAIFRKTAKGAILTKLDDDIELYAKAYSTMAKINLLSDMQRSLKAWEKLHGFDVSSHSAYGALKAVVARKLADFNPSPHSYSHVICIGWRIGCSTLSGDYFKFTDKDSGDMRGKCHEMMHAIQSAASAIPTLGVVDTAKTLKVFMAPEFYFRGAKGAYPPELVAEIIPTMKELGTSKDLYKDWLFVFGTAISAHQDTATYCTVCNSTDIKFVRDPLHPKKTIPQCKRDPSHLVQEGTYGAMIHNVALVQKCLDAHLVAKEYVSGIDYKSDKVTIQFGKKGGTSTEKYVASAGSSQNPRLKSKFDDERMGGCILTIDGMTIGLEVCLDHAHTKRTPMSGGRLAPYADKIQIQLIPSFGMSIGTGLYCMKGGVVFNVDGRGTGTSDLEIKGNSPKPTPQNASVRRGRGTLDIWGPFPIPRV